MHGEDADDRFGDIKIGDFKGILLFGLRKHPLGFALVVSTILSLIAGLIYAVVIFARTSFYPGPLTKFKLDDGTEIKCRFQWSEGCGYQFSMFASLDISRGAGQLSNR